ncbi:MAG: hypothetical protein KAJ21_05825 [Thermoplasmatales archaeon]|nr:hypothetical protein [Thermoplasmatales archaeon]
MTNLIEINEKIKHLKISRDILQIEYSKSEFHRKKEEHPDSTIPSRPEDEEIYKLLTAIQQLDFCIKKFQDVQFNLIKEGE